VVYVRIVLGLFGTVLVGVCVVVIDDIVVVVVNCVGIMHWNKYFQSF